MFEPKTYQERRNALNEILLQQVFQMLLDRTPHAERQELINMFSNWGRGQQILRSAEAARVLGDVTVAGVTNVQIQNILSHNLGRAYFGLPKHTDAPEGTIGSVGYSRQFKDFLGALPVFDASISPDMQSGFYRDEKTTQAGMPVLVIRDEARKELTIIAYRGGLSIDTLNIEHLPADYKWDREDHYALRGEMFVYRNTLELAPFLVEFAKAVKAQGVDKVYLPNELYGLAMAFEDQLPLDTIVAYGDSSSETDQSYSPVPEGYDKIDYVIDRVVDANPQWTREEAAINFVADAAVREGALGAPTTTEDAQTLDKLRTDMYEKCSAALDDMLLADPTAENYALVLGMSAAMYGPGDADNFNSWKEYGGVEKLRERIEARKAATPAAFDGQGELKH